MKTTHDNQIREQLCKLGASYNIARNVRPWPMLNLQLPLKDDETLHYFRSYCTFYCLCGSRTDEPFTVTPTEFRSYLGITDEDEIDMPVVYIRERRSLQPGAPNFPLPGSQLPTSITSNVERQGPNTAATINAQHKTDRYDVGATWSKLNLQLRFKDDETLRYLWSYCTFYCLRGSRTDEPFTVTPAELRSYLGITDEDEIEMPVVYNRERRSLQPGAPNFPMPGSQLPTSITSNVEQQGPNTAATINAQHKTDRYDVGATWSKVIRGPGKSKPNWSVGGTYRW
ncbi:hypothetical protein Trydic_g4661 [Trypoxylus dichotomus]